MVVADETQSRAECGLMDYACSAQGASLLADYSPLFRAWLSDAIEDKAPQNVEALLDLPARRNATEPLCSAALLHRYEVHSSETKDCGRGALQCW